MPWKEIEFKDILVGDVIGITCLESGDPIRYLGFRVVARNIIDSSILIDYGGLTQRIFEESSAYQYWQWVDAAAQKPAEGGDQYRLLQDAFRGPDPAQPKQIDDWPGPPCRHCGSGTYVGLLGVECQKGCKE